MQLVLHAGDVKSGSERCDDALLAARQDLYDAFEDPFVLTPGDNEWTDCHRVAAGSYLPTERLAEFTAREATALAWIDEAFDVATRRQAPAVLILMQAEPVAGEPGFAQIRERIVQRSIEFGRPVLLVHGDEHQFEEERAYAGVPNLTRLETFGDTADQWLRVRIEPTSPAVFSWEPVTVP